MNIETSYRMLLLIVLFRTIYMFYVPSPNILEQLYAACSNGIHTQCPRLFGLTGTVLEILS